MLDHLEFLFGEAFAALRRNAWMTFAAVSTAAIALFLIGGLGFTYFQVRDYASTLSSRFTMRAMLRDGTTFPEIKKTAETIRGFPGVAQVQWVPRAGEWEKWKKREPRVTEGLENPFPDALKIRVSDVDRTDQVVGMIQRLPQIDPEGGVEYLEPEQRFLSESLGLIRWLGFALGGLCFLTAGILIYNAIRLTVMARRREIRIMQLVGASHGTIRVPFLLEGAVHGALGGVLGTLLLWSAHIGISQRLIEFSSIGRPAEFPLGGAFVALILAGIFYGVLCSAIAVRSPLKLGAVSA